MNLAKISVFALIISVALGEFGRMSLLGQSFLVIDLLAFLVVFLGFMQSFSSGRHVKIGRTFWFAMLFLTVGFISLLFAFTHLPSAVVIKGAAYFLRYAVYLSLLLFVPYIVNDAQTRRQVFWVTIGTVLLMVVLGFLQLKYFSNFEELGLAEQGWDPHIGRLTSTWLDPNFAGGVFAFGFVSALAGFFDLPRYRVIFSICMFVCLLALYYTFSRSAYLFFMVAVFVFALLRARWLVIVGVLAMIPLMAMGGRFSERVGDMVDSASALFGTDNTKVLDATSRLRLESWNEAIEVAEKSPVVGSGFGTYEYASWQAGNLKDREVHHASGADSSLLTVLATTGYAGLIMYILFLLSMGCDLCMGSFDKNSRHRKIFALGSISACAGLLVHSMFVNSLFFSLMLALLLPSIALGISEVYQEGE